MKNLFVATSLFITSLLNAQDVPKFYKKIPQAWTGTIVLNSGEEIHCSFTYNPLAPEGLLFVTTDSLNYAYGPSHVKSFHFYDSRSGAEREFYSIPVKIAYRGGIRKYFFEAIYETPLISIIARNATTIKPSRKNRPFANTKYLIDHRDSFIHEMSKKQLLQLTIDHKNAVRNFIAQKKYSLDKKNVHEFVDVIGYYSSLKN